MAITDFRGEYRWLSNFGDSPIKYGSVVRDKYLYFPTVEHAFQSMKTFNHNEQDWVIESKTPGIARRRGQKVTLRDDWERMKVMYMRSFVEMKFEQNPELAKKLIATEGHFLVEKNTWGDKFWGVCEGRGLNWLGHILMNVRERLKKNV